MINPFLSRFRSLRYTLAAAMVVGLVVPSWVALESEKAEVQARLNDELKEDAERYGDLLLQALREPVWHLSPEFGAPVVDTLMRDNRITKIRVTLAPDDRVFLERAGVGPARPPIMTTLRTIKNQGKDVASISVDISAAGIQESVRAAELRFYWRTAMSLLSALTLIFLAFYFRLMRPVERLVRQSEGLAENHLNTPYAWNRLDEIGRVGRSLEHTRQVLANMFGELERVNQELLAENEERRKAEAALAQHAADLEDAVAKRTEALSKSNAELKAALANLTTAQKELVESEKLASLGRLVAGVAHELNTPVGNALMVGSTISDHMRGLQRAIDSGELKKSTMTKFMKEGGDACALLIRSLDQAAELIASFKQVAADQTTAQRRKFELGSVLQSITSTLQPRLKKTPFKLELHLEQGLNMDSYPGQLGQVVSNMVINAELHAFEGRTEGMIVVMAENAGDRVRVTISDNGNGIPEEIQGKVFDPFFTTKLGAGGTGLGLNIAHGLVTHVMGGRLILESREGLGTRFILDLPKVAPVVATSAVIPDA